VVTLVPIAYPAATKATAAARWLEPVCSAAWTCATAAVAERKGRPKANSATNHQ
jgi:hypothetical protein